MKTVMILLKAALVMTIFIGWPSLAAKGTMSHPLIGYWYVIYEELGAGVIYEFREENGTLNAYMVEIYDEEGNKVPDNTLAMTVKSFSGGKGVADYFIEDEGEQYELESQLKLVGDKLEISYSFYGFDEKEVWERVRE